MEFTAAAVTLREGEDVALVTTGIMAHKVLAAADQLQTRGISAHVLHLPTLKPLDVPAIIDVAQRFDRLITVENHSIIGGLGSAIAETVTEHAPVRVPRIGIRDRAGHAIDSRPAKEQHAVTSASNPAAIYRRDGPVNRLQGKIVGITGGGAGFGRAMALAFAREGAEAVAICDLNMEDAAATVKDLEEIGAKTLAVELDVTDTAGLRAYVQQIVDTFGRLDVWVGNAGIAGGSPAEDESEEFWRKMIDLDLNAVFFGAQAAGRQMLEQGGGVILSTASMLIEQHTQAYRTAYGVAKTGVVNLTRALAVEWGGRGIRVNAIGPGFANTGLFQRGRTAHSIPVEDLLSRVPMGRFVEVEEIAAAAVFLASDEASFINGHLLLVDGGWSANSSPT